MLLRHKLVWAVIPGPRVERAEPGIYNHRPCSCDESSCAAVAHITAWGYGFRARRFRGAPE
jgi:hypothetical protein